MKRLLFGALSMSLGCSGASTTPDSGTPPRDAVVIGADAPPITMPDTGPMPPTSIVSLRDDELDIMPLGDSITLGVNGGYRNGLYTSLTEDGYTVDLVGSLNDEYTRVADHDHEGHSGFTTGNVRENIEAWLGADPDVVLLMLGTNDIAWWIAESPLDVAVRLEELVDFILASRSDMVVVVATIAPLAPMLVEPDDRERADLANEYNASIRTRFASNPRVRVADVNAALTVADLYDGVHPSEEAHARIAQVWAQTLRPLLPPP
jgi:lysophospholipase L1-like esterase